MIYCIGDSFTAGAELPDVGPPPQLKCSNLAWPTKLGELLDRPTVNLGRQGCSNDRIINRALECVWRRDADLVIVAWSVPGRIDMLDPHGNFAVWAGNNSFKGDDIRVELVKLLTTIYNDKSDNWYLRKWLRQVILLQAFFQKHNQRYFMVQTHVSQKLNKNFWNYNSDLTNQIDPEFFIGWPFLGFNDWTVGIPKMPQQHPSEQGHLAIAQQIHEFMKKFGW
jgi:hypothetical protein